jgi:hypothetical protein
LSPSITPSAEQIGLLSALGQLVAKGVMSFNDASSYGATLLTDVVQPGVAQSDIDRFIADGLRILEQAAFEDEHPTSIGPVLYASDSPGRRSLMHAVANRHAAIWGRHDQIVFDTDLHIDDRTVAVFIRLTGNTVTLSDEGQILKHYQSTSLKHLQEGEILSGLRSALDSQGFFLNDTGQIVAAYDINLTSMSVFTGAVKSIIADYVSGISRSVMQFQQYYVNRLILPRSSAT